MKTPPYKLLALFFSLSIWISCSNEESQPDVPTKDYTLSGRIQDNFNAPHYSVEITGLNSDLSSSGFSHNTPVVDINYSFEDVAFAYEQNTSTVRHVELRTLGAYPLSAIADLEQKETININYLTHLQAIRTRYLVVQENMSIENALSQSKEELDNLFSIGSIEIVFDQLDLFTPELDHSALIFVSSAFSEESILTTSELINYANFFNDIQDEFATSGGLETQSLRQWLSTNISFSPSKTLIDVLRVQVNAPGIDYDGFGIYSNFKEQFMSQPGNPSELSKVLQEPTSGINLLIYEDGLDKIVGTEDIFVEFDLSSFGTDDFVVLFNNVNYVDGSSIDVPLLSDATLPENNCAPQICYGTSDRNELFHLDFITENYDSQDMYIVFVFGLGNLTYRIDEWLNP